MPPLPGGRAGDKRMKSEGEREKALDFLPPNSPTIYLI